VIHEITQAIWLDSPKGLCLAKFIIDRGMDSDLEWVAVIQETGECWTFSNEDIRFCKNLTLNRRCEWSRQPD
jgi:hypothetical protein